LYCSDKNKNLHVVPILSLARLMKKKKKKKKKKKRELLVKIVCRRKNATSNG
jgi:hypothetical protein